MNMNMQETTNSEEFELPEPTEEQKKEFEKVKQEAIYNYLEGKPTEMV